MPVGLSVYLIHLSLEDMTVSRGVLHPVEPNPVMYHLMDDDIFEDRFLEIDTGGYADVAIQRLGHGRARMDETPEGRAGC